MRKQIAIAFAAIAIMASVAHASDSVEDTVNKFFAASEGVQIAINSDYCTNFDADNAASARATLHGDDAKAYDDVEASLRVAFDASAGTDAAVESVRYEFCVATSETK